MLFHSPTPSRSLVFLHVVVMLIAPHRDFKPTDEPETREYHHIIRAPRERELNVLCVIITLSRHLTPVVSPMKHDDTRQDMHYNTI